LRKSLEKQPSAAFPNYNNSIIYSAYPDHGFRLFEFIGRILAIVRWTSSENFNQFLSVTSLLGSIHQKLALRAVVLVLHRGVIAFHVGA
jgi:hypothetical protein